MESVAGKKDALRLRHLDLNKSCKSNKLGQNIAFYNSLQAQTIKLSHTIIIT